MVAQQRPCPTDAPVSDLAVWRCWRCGKIIARLRLLTGCAVEIKCKCGALNIAAVDKGAPAP